jgi:hypothetical protein
MEQLLAVRLDATPRTAIAELQLKDSQADAY